MMKFFISLLIFLTGFTSAQGINFSSIDERVNQYLFNGEWHKSDSLITLELMKHPESIKYNFMKAYNLYYARYFAGDAFDRPTTLQKVKHYTWKAITAGEKLEENLENNFYLGCAYAYLARANAMQQEYWEAYWNAGKSENYLEAVLDEEPGVHDAYMNLGIFEYYPDAAISGFRSFLAWLGGMSGDRELGLEYIYKVSEKGTLFKDEAIFALGIINNFAENNLEEAHHYWKVLADKYPGNNFAQAQENRARFQVLIEQKGVEFLRAELDSLASKYQINNPNILNGMGYLFMNQGRLDDALEVFKVNIELYPHIANGYDSIAECYMNRGENELAIQHYQKAYDMMPDDTTATEEFKQRVMDGVQERLEELKSRVNS
jgi:tetratricopeptide (TPR) repeat protein